MDRDVIVSVVIPAYNREKLIGRCLGSILNQTFQDFEIIVVDDCSADKTVEVVNNFTDSRVRTCVKLEKNSGACFARNHGASLARGKYIAFQDSDDEWLPDKLEKQVKYLEEHDYDMVFCGMTRKNPFSGKENYFPPYAFAETKDAQQQLLYENCVSTQCILIKKEAFEKVRFDDAIRKFQDWDFAIRAAKCLKMGYLPEALVVSEVQQDSISRTVPRYDSLKVLFDKYNGEIIGNLEIHARFLKKMGDAFYKKEPKRAAGFYKKSVGIRFDAKVFGKMLISAARGGGFIGE